MIRDLERLERENGGRFGHTGFEVFGRFQGKLLHVMLEAGKVKEIRLGGANAHAAADPARAIIQCGVKQEWVVFKQVVPPDLVETTVDGMSEAGFDDVPG